MINSANIQSAYVNLYTQLRKYIWAFSTVEKLAELEVAAYKKFPDLSDISNKYNALYIDVKSVANKDEELSNALTEFSDIINSSDGIYATINQVREVIPV